jgi:hypothetical protein
MALVNTAMNLRAPLNAGISFLFAEELLECQEGLSSMDLVS